MSENLISPNLSNLHSKNEDISIYKRYILLSKLLGLAVFFSFSHIILDIWKEWYLKGFFDLAIGVVFLIIFFINKKGGHKLAGYLTWSFLSISVFVCVNLVPREIGVNLLFIVLVGITFVFWGYKQQLERVVASLFTIGLFLISEYYEYQAFGSDAVIDGADGFSFVFNFLTAALILYTSLHFIVQSNYKAELALKENAKELQELSDEAKIQNAHLEKVNAELDRFVYSTSHDLKGPLASIKGLANVAQLEEPDNPLQSYFKMINERVAYLEKFIYDISQYSRNSRQEIAHTPVYLEELAKEAIENLRFSGDADKISFEITDKIKEVLVIDAYRINVILNNLLSNAIKYHNYRQPKPTIKIYLEKSGSNVSFKVSDNGIGIAPDQVNKIFDMFHRATERSDGAGLGLYITKEAVEKLKGRISVQSIPGKGTSFTVNIPLIYPVEEPFLIPELSEA